ncbi:hypothetical protein [Methylobacterium gregans]|uniref:Uncharacterized protein n=1 Tax=Methylobacterium gregans TaxID=374424 RepID=A0AA37HQX5_9HYPH|nr:hypothetical protein [Methylobacterium gregans]MDQ0519239.1 hypothetical protein [Methylobacterium gregans]GJD80034.1 hypothetical protein NBEOAGPD_3266 [Methylobacterium gregans]GLS53122.1 hypothetical protein GCM10007886_13050 [Methylobacterium gregans]
MKRLSRVVLVSAALIPLAAQAAGRLQLDDKASLWPRAGMEAKIDFTNRMGKSMVQLSPELSNAYFMRCLEETANIGDTKELTLGDLVRTCVSLQMGRAE